jgi:hypothetical protein
LLENYEDMMSLKMSGNELGRPRMPTRVTLKTMKTVQKSIEEEKGGDN